MKIIFENVSFQYNNKLPDKKPVLENINFKIDGNEFVGIVGPSGSGKTTLVQHFTGLLQPTAGKILIDHVDISTKTVDIDSIRRKIGIVFQFPETQLFEETVYDDIAFAPKNFGITGKELEDRVISTFKLMDLDIDKMRNRPPFKLSEGEKRRVALAGVIAMNPEVLVLDEPSACLDAAGIRKIEQLLTSLHDIGKTIVLVSHNLEFIARLCKRIVVLMDGKISFDGSREELFECENILKESNIEIPRIVRYSRRLFGLEYISKSNLYSAEDIKVALGV